MSFSLIKRTIKAVLLCILICFFLFFIMFLLLQQKNIRVIHGKITTHFFDAEYSDGTFLIDTDSGFYMDTSMTLDLASSKFHKNLQAGDSVYVLCKIDPKEISPMGIKIYYIL